MIETDIQSLVLEPFCGIRPINNIFINNDLTQGETAWPAAPIDSIKELVHLFIKKKLILDESPAYYIYKISKPNSKSYLGLVGLVSPDLFKRKVIKEHEETIEERVRWVLENLTNTGLQIDPLLMLHQANEDLEKFLQINSCEMPSISLCLGEDILHEVWKINSKQQIYVINTLLKNISVLYIADGHHRAKAVQKNQQVNQRKVMAMLLPFNQVEILDYSRILVTSIKEQALFDLLKVNFLIRRSKTVYCANRPRSFGLYLNNIWYQLDLKHQERFIDKLDAEILDELVINLIKTICSNTQVKYLSISESDKKFMSCVDSEENSIGLTIPPVSVEQFIERANNSKIMPAKSTWIEPKIPRGIISYFS